MHTRGALGELQRRDSDDAEAAEGLTSRTMSSPFAMTVSPIKTRSDSFRTRGVPSSFVDRLRATGVDDLGQPLVRITRASGGEPLRDQLRRAEPGEEILLGSHELFAQASPFREFGPVYVSAMLPRPEAFADVFTSGYIREECVVRAYDRRGWILQADRAGRDEARGQIETWLGDPRIGFVDARFLAYGCFACRFERAELTAAS